MAQHNHSRIALGVVTLLLGTAWATPARGDELWVAPTYQRDAGGLGIGSNKLWPVTRVGAVRLAWAIPDNLQTFQSATLVLISHSPGGAATLNVSICPAQHSDPVVDACVGPVPHAFTGGVNQLTEVDVTATVAAEVGVPGATYLAVFAYTTPTTKTDHIVGLRFSYDPVPPSGVATLGANTFTGTQTAPFFVGDGAGLTNLPIPSGVATLGENTFTGTQTIDLGNLDLDASTAATGNLTKNGTRFLHNLGVDNTFLGENAGTSITPGILGFANTAIGSRALRASTSGALNTAIGVAALTNNTIGGNNVAVGGGAGSNATTGFNNIYLGGAVFGVAGESNTMYLGRVGLQTRTFVAGTRGVTTALADAIPVMIDSAGQLGTISSSRRFKEDIRDMADTSRRLLQLRPVSFRYRQAFAGGVKPIQYGLVAEEVAEVFPELAVRNAAGEVESVHYETLNVLLLNEVQQQQRHLEVLEQRLNKLIRQLSSTTR